MKKSIVTIALIGALFGCNSDGDDSAPDFQQSYVKDGIYINSTDLIVMLIDTDLNQNSVLVGDYLDESLYFNDTHSISGNKMINKGLSYVSSYLYEHDPSLETEISFSEHGATITGVVDNQNLVYSFSRTSESAPLSALTGTYTNPNDGSTWAIESDGSFVVNGICTLTGQLIRVKGYFSAENVNATGCYDETLNASDYNARVITVEHSGTTYALGALENGSAILWGSVPIL